ncbi:ATP-dependent RNA helicase RhlE [Desulfosarcina alkanivorans]|uniref:ATP-dependent RNA helicase RhlE n=1 Tax=Desulfosarcina alkanivorans TaxID=571177 RepID=A0A5K7YHT4_9BACT|nr:DEAD/DEAH box helicase [Desulfosarcina alkanivorans]BBO67429.1 ATP-dependent RNA helicase RhlE [Desulfosarcina alkanivorans]
MSFDHLGLRSELLEAVKAKGYTAPTPIQSRAVPVILGGRDILARAQTGTGKTDAFALPLVEILSRENISARHPRALVLAPTRELALQVGETIKDYARRVSMRCTVVHGGGRINPQIDRLRRGIDILVATPGRLLDLSGQRHLDLSRIGFLVFDEADRMLDLGFSEAIAEILDLVPIRRRTMLFSATYTPSIRNLAAVMLKEPQEIEATPSLTAAESVVQKVHLVNRANKCALLVHLLTKGNWDRILVFTRTRHGANKLTEKLSAQGIVAAAMHGDKSQSSRTRTLQQFKEGRIRVLVATDVAARGLDISNLPHVVNYDMPGTPEDYVHRIGRTGRAGVRGIAVSLVSPDEKRHLQAIEKLLEQKIPVETVDGYTEDSDVPDYVLFRPGSLASHKKADRDLKEMVLKRNARKQESKSRTAGKKRKSLKKPARPGFPRPPKPGKPKRRK